MNNRSKSKLALAMVVHGSEEPENLRRCLNSIARFVDGIFISVTTDDKGVGRVAEEFGAVVDYCPYKFHHTITSKEHKKIRKILGFKPTVEVGDKLFLFDEARNHNFAQVGKEYDWIMWMDSDDVWMNPERLKEVLWIAENKEPVPAEAIFVNYIYLAEIVDGKIREVVIEHLREQIIRNVGVYKWVAPIHETLIEQRPTEKMVTDLCQRLHLSEGERLSKAIFRNIKTLEYSIMQTKGADPRPIYYLGKAYFDLKTEDSLKRAEKLFKIYLFGTEKYGGDNRSGWAEERSQCFSLWADIFRQREQFNNCLKSNMNALIESDKFPVTYLDIALSFLLKEKWESAIRWVKIAAKIEQPHTTLVSNPRDEKARALEILYTASLNLYKIDDAWAAVQKLVELFPDGEKGKAMLERLEFVNDLQERRDTTKALVRIAQHLQKYGEVDKLRMLVASAPNTIKDNPFVADLHKRVFPPKTWEDNEVAIYCGPGFTNWSPKKLEEPGTGFIGGSEEAVIYLSWELAKLGWRVTVYADPGEEEGGYKGVNFLPYYQFNSNDEFNILIGWRRPEFVDGNYRAKKIWIWCHDIQNNLNYTKERLEKIDKVVVLSPWHRTNIPDVPNEKVLISSNGIVI